ncbi:hypothetical protein DACRYDRAFT_113519 [Dacryopinax primogenitus]|uniref:Uncharacterized protein n=1 Tax=Dacryopinax primogenitus (strain DJM 731) TaxID=1858805 RepID=M5GEF1_DACPD|nr:uncharacterized protein DACRYDRAFT_113519 [Dacryopinax primogenitus]EJU05382.1 hypothetical protein DACRYDRAFT_113519 [Dacryopinax primogenitus]
MHPKLTALTLMSLVVSAQAAAIPRPLKLRDVVDITAVAKILPNNLATSDDVLHGDAILAHTVVLRDNSSPLSGVLSLVDGLLNDALGGILPASALNATESALNTVAGLLLTTNPSTTGSSSQTQYVMIASSNRSTTLFLVPSGPGNAINADSAASKSPVTIHIPIIEEATGQMVDSCLTYDQNPVSSSILAATPCAPDTDHASQKFMYDSSTGIVEPMFDSATPMDLATQTPSYTVNAASVNPDDASSSNVLIVFTPATDSVPVTAAALSDGSVPGDMAYANDDSTDFSSGDLDDPAGQLPEMAAATTDSDEDSCDEMGN